MNKERRAAVKEAIANIEVAVESLAGVRELEAEAIDDEEGKGDSDWVDALEEAENTITDALDQLKGRD